MRFRVRECIGVVKEKAINAGTCCFCSRRRRRVVSITGQHIGVRACSACSKKLVRRINAEWRYGVAR